MAQVGRIRQTPRGTFKGQAARTVPKQHLGQIKSTARKVTDRPPRSSKEGN